MLKIGEFFKIRELYQKGWTQMSQPLIFMLLFSILHTVLPSDQCCEFQCYELKRQGFSRSFAASYNLLMLQMLLFQAMKIAIKLTIAINDMNKSAKLHTISRLASYSQMTMLEMAKR
jgi:hypothetical protein